MYNINEVLSATYVHSNNYGTSNGDLRVFIPSLMPELSIGTPISIPVTLNKSCYINAAECKPSVATKINTQNYITAKSSFNSYKYPYYRYGSGIKVIVKDPDCLTCKLAPEEEDNSFDIR